MYHIFAITIWSGFIVALLGVGVVFSIVHRVLSVVRYRRCEQRALVLVGIKRQIERVREKKHPDAAGVLGEVEHMLGKYDFSEDELGMFFTDIIRTCFTCEIAHREKILDRVRAFISRFNTVSSSMCEPSIDRITELARMSAEATQIVDDYRRSNEKCQHLEKRLLMAEDFERKARIVQRRSKVLPAA